MYYYRYSAELEYPIYCRKKLEETAQEEVILDVNELAKGHGFCNVANVNPSHDHKLLGYAIDLKGRRIYDIKFMDLSTGKHLDDVIEKVTSNFVWVKKRLVFFFFSLKI